MSYNTIDEHWLKRAEEARVAAKQLTDLCAKEKMLGIAESYERRACCAWGRFPTPVRIH
jgi:hypothetical protein